MKIEIPCEAVEQILFNSIIETFESFMQPSADHAVLGLTIDQMDNILAGAMNYSKWVCSRTEQKIIMERWLAWTNYKAILEDD
jgi:hypothetical protein